MQRPRPLSRFIDVLHTSLLGRMRAEDPARQWVLRMDRMLSESSGDVGGNESSQALPACRHLDTALANAAMGPPDIVVLAGAFRALVPELNWRHRTALEQPDSPSFRDSHANTQVIGPSGLERRSDMVMGASLLAPHTVYPDHHHPPPEIYVVLSEGNWFQQGLGWHTPGTGGLVVHQPGVTHAMRSGVAPLLAIWCLWPELSSSIQYSRGQ